MRKTLLAALLCIVAGCQTKNQSRAGDDAPGQDPNSINTPAGKPPPEAPGPAVPEAQPRKALTR